MELRPVIDRLLARAPLAPFAEGGGIPWSEPAFSRRVLREHLCQDHDRASRPLDVIDRQVAWTLANALPRPGGRVLDLGCGPGLHTSRLAAAGCSCVGIDWSPAAIEYARGVAASEGLACEYRLEDVREADLGTGFDLVSMWFGEFDTLAPAAASALLARVARALAPDGRVLLELHVPGYVREIGEAAADWSVHEQGVFADEPHLVLRESVWHSGAGVATERYVVLCSEAPPAVYVQSTRAADDDVLAELLAEAGLAVHARYGALTGDPADEGSLYGLVLEQVAPEAESSRPDPVSPG